MPVAISPMVSSSANLRPLRSPTVPIRMPPSGRATKPTPNTAKVDNSATVGVERGKNCLAMSGARNA